MLENFGVTEENWRDALGVPAPAELRRLRVTSLRRARRRCAGRRPRTRALEPAVGHSGQLAREYGFTDVDGSQPDVWRYIDDVERGCDTDPDDYR